MKPLIIGVGNRWRGDDGLGPRAIDALEAKAAAHPELPPFDTVELDGEPARLVFAWAGRPLAVVIDAIRTGARPGVLHCLDALDRELTAPPSASTHGAGVACAVALGRALDRLPERLIVLGIEPAQTDHGDTFSAPVAASFERLVARAAEEVSSACV